jgi:integrase
MARYIQKIGKNFYFARRLPLAIAKLEGRSDIKISLKTDSENEALVKAKVMAEQLEMRWEALLNGDTDDASRRWEAVTRIARSYGVDYKPLPDIVSTATAKDILARLSILEGSGRLKDKTTVSALLGGEAPPKILLGKVLDLYWSQTKDKQVKKSDNQLRKWKNPRVKAFNNLISKIGNKPITEITRNDALDFRDWWMTRMIDDGLTANSANKDITHISTILRVICEHYRMPWSKPFEGLRFREEGGQKAPSYSDRYIREKFLKNDGLENLDPDQRLVFFILIETGARPGEIINLQPERIRLNAKIPHIEIASNPKREVKTKNANRTIPLVGIALWAMRQRPHGFPALHDREDSVSGNINKYLRNMILKKRKVISSIR